MSFTVITDDERKELDKLRERCARYREALERISIITGYVESHSTGNRQYYLTEGAEIAKEALAEPEENSK